MRGRVQPLPTSPARLCRARREVRSALVGLIKDKQRRTGCPRECTSFAPDRQQAHIIIFSMSGGMIRCIICIIMARFASGSSIMRPFMV